MRWYLTNLLLIFFISVHAQNLTDTITPRELFVRFNPTGLADLLDLTISFGAEHRVSREIAVALDAAYIPYSNQIEGAKRTRGFIIRPAFRFYPHNKRIYIEGELHYKQVTHTIEDWLSREVVDEVGSFEQFMTFRYRKQVTGFRLKAGRIYKLTRDARLWCELYAGGGLHFTRFKVVDQPRSAYRGWNSLGVNVAESSLYPVIPMGFRIMYRITSL